MNSVQCNKCWEYQKPLLEVHKDDKGNVIYDKSPVICSNCGAEMTSITIFSKRSMYHLGQVKKDEGHKKAFSVQCPSCGKKDQPIIINDIVSCAHCNNSLEHLPKPFLHSIRQHLQK